jgi:hypothetical protein
MGPTWRGSIWTTRPWCFTAQGVKFHNKPPVNGRELKAQDVKYFERFAKSGFRARFDDVDRRSRTITP